MPARLLNIALVICIANIINFVVRFSSVRLFTAIIRGVGLVYWPGTFIHPVYSSIYLKVWSYPAVMDLERGVDQYTFTM